MSLGKKCLETNDKRHTKTYNKINSSVGGNKKLERSWWEWSWIHRPIWEPVPETRIEKTISWSEWVSWKLRVLDKTFNVCSNFTGKEVIN